MLLMGKSTIFGVSSQMLPSGYVKIAIENGYLVRGFSH